MSLFYDSLSFNVGGALLAEDALAKTVRASTGRLENVAFGSLVRPRALVLVARTLAARPQAPTLSNLICHISLGLARGRSAVGCRLSANYRA